jgi:hypothetical protein
MVRAYSRKTPSIWVLADPDLINNHGANGEDFFALGWRRRF